MKKDRNYELDGMRGIAALAVALGHCNTRTTGLEVWSKSITDFPSMSLPQIIGRLGHVLFPADAAVIVFFVLSGYVLWGSMLKKQTKSLISFAPYFTSRLYRLLPATIISALIYAVMIPVSGKDVVQNALILSINMNGVLWTLQIEMVASVSLFIAFLFVRNYIHIILLFLLSVYLNTQYASYLLLYHIPFLLGAALHYFSFRPFKTAFWCVLAYLALITADLLFQRGSVSQYVRFFSAWILVGAVVHQRFSFLTSRPIQFLGTVSYSFYLMHGAALLLTTRLLNYWGWHPINQLIDFLTVAVLSVAVALPVSWFMYVFVEKPGIIAGAHVVNSLNQWLSHKSLLKHYLPFTFKFSLRRIFN